MMRETELLAPLPASVRSLAANAEHPGLWLDKYACTWNPEWFSGRDEAKLSENVQKPAIEKVAELTQQAAGKAASDFAAALLRHTAMLDAVRARPFTATTAGPLTLHLARAAALENAGLALHPLYGFTYLPASGLKGMARAYAEAVWLPSQPEQAAAWHLIEDVFGWAPTPDRRKQIASQEHPATPRIHNDKEITASAGQAVFHDAWPTAWPQLRVDIVNNHHPDYYGADEKKVPVPPPGDWENPRPVYFLAVKPGTQFRFALAPARRDTDPKLLAQAEAWLLGALTHEGAGAKTAAGYGRFRADAEEVRARTPELPEATRAVFEAELELVTPAFLAGAEQNKEDCDLRPATLRGLLRWWWRTMHAGFVTPEELRALETAVWGSAEVGGAVRIAVERVRREGPHLYDYKDRFRPKSEFKREHGLADSPNNKTTQGLFYLSYGMDEVSQGEKRQRYYLDAGSKWKARFSARESSFRPKAGQVREAAPAVVSAAESHTQARAALWLLCTFGGVGSKARKGFGSLRVGDLQIASLGDCRRIAQEFREARGMHGEFREEWAESSALGESSDWCLEANIELPSNDAWQTLDAVGFAYQAFAQQHKNDADKAALGLPRKIHGPNDKPLQTKSGQYIQDPETHKRPQWLRSLRWEQKTDARKARYASPVHFHVMPTSGGCTVKMLAFPAAGLPNLATSNRMLNQLMERMRTDLPGRLTGHAATPGSRSSSHSATTQRAPAVSTPARSGPEKRAYGTPATGILLEQDEKGRFRFQEPGRSAGRITLGTQPDPLPEPGSEIQVFIQDDAPNNLQYRWDLGAKKAPSAGAKPSQRQRGGRR